MIKNTVVLIFQQLNVRSVNIKIIETNLDIFEESL